MQNAALPDPIGPATTFGADHRMPPIADLDFRTIAAALETRLAESAQAHNTAMRARQESATRALVELDRQLATASVTSEVARQLTITANSDAQTIEQLRNQMSTTATSDAQIIAQLRS